jgi:hypothetical protein
MKRVIKFLFPKTYQAIYDEAYGYGRYDMNEEWMCANGAYDDDEINRAQYEMNMEIERLHHEHYVENEYYYPEDYINEQDELARLHDEHCAQLIEEYEEDCRREEQELAEIYLPKAPDLQVGDKIHLHSKQGMYTVVEVYTDSFAYNTAYSDISYADYEDYKCHAGGMWKLRRGN